MRNQLHAALGVGVLALAAVLGGTASAATASRSAAVDTSHASKTIVQIAVGDPDLSTLVTALQAAGLVSTLEGKGPFTVYAPTNEAFARVPTAIFDDWLADTSLLAKVLLHHVTPGFFLLSDANGIAPLPAADGTAVFVQKNLDGCGEWCFHINNASSVGQPIVASNGIIYVIQSVLQPQF